MNLCNNLTKYFTEEVLVVIAKEKEDSDQRDRKHNRNILLWYNIILCVQEKK